MCRALCRFVDKIKKTKNKKLAVCKLQTRFWDRCNFFSFFFFWILSTFIYFIFLIFSTLRDRNVNSGPFVRPANVRLIVRLTDTYVIDTPLAQQISIKSKKKKKKRKSKIWNFRTPMTPIVVSVGQRHLNFFGLTSKFIDDSNCNIGAFSSHLSVFLHSK